jgi:response regulator RpfG family c-di-GMP phosphodiesterase
MNATLQISTTETGHSPILLFSNFFSVLNNFTPFHKIRELITDQNQARALHLIITDDDSDDQELFSMAISEISKNIKISLAENGTDLIKKLQEKELPDLIFLDLNMPGMNGIECLAKIRSTPSLAELPVLIYSTSANPEQIDEAYNNGANYYLQKPCSYREIQSLVTKVFSLSIDQLLNQPERADFLVR